MLVVPVENYFLTNGNKNDLRSSADGSHLSLQTVYKVTQIPNTKRFTITITPKNASGAVDFTTD